MPLSFDLTERLHEGRITDVYRGVLDDGRPIVAKVLKDASAGPSQIARFRAEYALMASLHLDGVARTIGLVAHAQGLALLMPDIGGVSLRRLSMKRALSVAAFCDYAERICRALGSLHSAGWLHNDVNPSNVVINIGTQRLELIDLGLASPSRKTAGAVDLSPGMQGRLAYMSPERTGRMNRPVDHRSDLYSLGITFYELLAGHVPFETEDPVALVHAHVARRPTPLSVASQLVPDVLSRIVDKLLEKNPEDRYESAHAVEADLARCREHLDAHGSLVGLELTTGTERTLGAFPSSMRLVGRKAELDMLRGMYAHVQSGGRSVLVLRGAAGVGKTTLVERFAQEVSAAGGVLIEGRFEQSQRGTVFAALGRALTTWCQMVASLPADVRNVWRERLQQELGSDTGVLSRVVPDLDLAMGRRVSRAEPEPGRDRSRVRPLLGRLLAAAPSPSRPLVLFLDDAQWADFSSMSLLSELLENRRPEHLFIILAVRAGDDSSPSEDLIAGLARVRGCQTRTCELEQLMPRGVEEMLHELIGVQDCADLARVVHEKTAGNPHFVRDLLERLLRDQLVRYDDRSRGWVWDIEGIEIAQITDNMVEVLNARIRGLSILDKELLRYGACLGNEFAIADMVGLPMSAITADDDMMLSALRLVGEGLLLPSPWDGRFQFAHEEVRQAALALIPADERAAVEVQIARSLIQSDADPWGERLFGVVDRVNEAESVIVDPSERLRFAELNLQAGRLALQARAQQVAVGYFDAGIGFLPPHCWDSVHQLSLDLHLGAARAALLGLDYESVEGLGRVVEGHCPEPLERVDHWIVQIEGLTARGRQKEALSTGMHALAGLGLVPQAPSLWRSWFRKGRLRGQLRALTDTWSVAFSACEDPHELAISRLCNALMLPLLQTPIDQLSDLLDALLPRMRTHGCPPHAPLFLASGGALLAARGELGSGDAAAKLAVALASREGLQPHRARTELLVQLTLSWRARPLREVASTVWAAVEEMLTAADAFVSLAVSHGLGLRVLSGGHLQRLASDAAWGESLLHRLGARPALINVRAIGGFLARLRGGDEGLAGSVGLDDELEWLRSQGNLSSVAHLQMWLGIEALLWGDSPKAIADLTQASAGLARLKAFAVGPCLRFYLALARLQLPQLERGDLRRVEQSVRALEQVSDGPVADNAPRVALLQAELARHRGDVVAALDGYDRAIDGARVARLPLEEAMAHERAAHFHELAGRQTVAQSYLRSARSVWSGLGAAGMVHRLDERLPRALVADDAGTLSWDKTASPSTDLELKSVVRASQALSAETDPERVIATLMQLLLESSGATLGSLLILTPAGLRERASATAEDGVSVSQHDCALHAGVASVRVVSLVHRSRDVVLVSDARRDARFLDDPQLLASGGRAVLGVPLERQGRLTGIIYLENSLAPDVFTKARVELIRTLSSQAAISLENSRLVGELRQHREDLEYLVEQRTRALAREKKQTAALLDNLADGVITIDENGTIEGFSAVASQMFGYTPTEVIGRNIDLVMPGSGREPGSPRQLERQESDSRLLLRGTRRLDSVRGRRKDGSEFPIEIAVAKVVLDDHLIFSGVVRDMTEAHAAAARLEAARQAAEKANLAKSVFLASMSHEIRTPLNAVLGFAQLLRRDDTLSVEARERVELIERAGSHLLMLLNSILEMSKIEAGRIELRETDFDLRSLLVDIVGMFRGTATAKGIDVVADVSKEVPTIVHADELKLRQILANLVGNAVKFTDRGGVELRARATSQSDSILLRLSVCDTGPGMADADLSRVFEKFAQASVGADKSGTGLGLAISREYAALMGGTITVQSELGVGTTFDLSLPVTPPKSGELARSRAERVIVGLSEGHPPVRVLVADDLEDNRRFMSDLLGSVGIEVRDASHGRDALTMLDSWMPDLVLTDLRMPQMDGWELIAAIRQRPDCADLPIVAVSASVIGTIGRQVIEAGANDFIMKPVRASEVFDALEQLCGVRFEVFDGIAATPAPQPLDPKTVREAVELSEPLRLALIDAAVHIELERLSSLVDELGNTVLAEQIRALMDDFDYDRIAILLGGDPDAD